MRNIILLYFRQTSKKTPREIAAHIGVSVKEYNDIETGERILSVTEAKELGKLFNTKGSYFLGAALQLDLLLARNEIIKIFNQRIDDLSNRLRSHEKPVAKRPKK